MIKLEERSVVVHLSDEGRRVLRQVGVGVPDTPGVLFDVEGTHERGIWVRLEYEDGPHVFLVRWEYILAMDISVGQTVTAGPVH